MAIDRSKTYLSLRLSSTRGERFDLHWSEKRSIEPDNLERRLWRNGIVKAYVNEVQIYMSEEPFPVGEYREPHLAVRYGVAQFEYIRVYVIPS